MKKFKEKKYRILLNLFRYSFVIVFCLSLYGSIALADISPNSSTTTPATSSGVKIDAGIKNPLGDKLVDLPSFIKAIVQIVLVVGVPLLALAIIYSGFLFVKAQGNSEELTKAKHALLYTVIGGALLLGAFVISNAIVSTVNQIGNGV